MKKYGSVIMLFARSTIYRQLILLAAMAAAEATMFWVAMQTLASLEATFAQSRISWACAVFFLLFTAVLARSGCDRGAKTGYTLRRLRIGHKSVFFCQSAYNAVCYFIFWAVQTAIVFALFRYYTAVADASYVGSQSLLLAFYRDDFLHSLLPLEETSRYVRNGILAVCLGIATAYYPMCQRAGKTAFEPIALVCLTLPFFPGGMGSFGGDMLLSVVALSLVAVVLRHVFEQEARYFAVSAITQEHDLLDYSRVPGGYGIYRLPCGTQDTPLSAIVDGLELFYPLARTEEMIWLQQSADQTKLFLVTQEENAYILKVLDAKTARLLQRIPLLEADGSRWMSDFFIGADFLAIFFDDRDFVVLSQAPGGDYVWEYSGALPEPELFAFNRMYDSVIAFDGKRLAVAAMARDRALCGFSLTVCDQTGVLYAGRYDSSLDKGQPENYHERCNAAGYAPLQLHWK